MRSPSFHPWFHRCIWALVYLGLGFLGLSVLIYTQYYPFGHDEHMYILAPWMMAKGGILYQQVPFLQTPLLPLLYRSLFSLMPVQFSFLLLPRLLNGFAMIGVAACLGWIAWRSSNRRWLGGVLFVVGLFHEVILFSSRQADNAILPLFFLALGLLLWINRMKGSSPKLLLAAGICFGLSVSLKLYYAALLPGFILGTGFLAWRATRAWKDLLRNILWMGAGMVLGLLPTGYFLIWHTDAFIFQNVTYHVLNAMWRMQGGYVGVTWPQKLALAYDLFARPINIFLGIIICQSLIFLLSDRRSKENGAQWEWIGVLGVQFIFALLTAFFPTPVMPNYFTQSFLFLMVIMAVVSANLVQEREREVRALCCGLIFITFFSLPKLVRFLPAAAHGQPTVATQVHSQGRTIQALLRSRGILEGKIATLAPIPIIEAGYEVYPAFSTGPFLYRVGDLLGVKEREKYGLASSSTLAAYLASDPPIGVYIGCERDEGVEDAFLDYIQQNRFELLPSGQLGCGKLYVRPTLQEKIP